MKKKNKSKTFFEIATPVKSVKKYNILSTSLGDTWSEKEANPKYNKGGFIIRWVCKDIGFGELTFYKNPKGKLVCETECMSESFVRQVMEHFLKSTKLLDK